MKKLLSVCFVFVIVFVACSNNDIMENMNDGKQAPVIYEDDFYLKKNFGFALAKMMEDNVSARKFIKEEALRMFNNDYDILYHLVKDKKLENGTTFREALLKFYEDKDELFALERKFPLLTIFIPELPENSFSANIWDIEMEIPMVALLSTRTNNIPILNAKGEEFILESQYIPAFPIIVLKDNERVTVKTNISASNTSNVLKSTNGDLEFAFLDKCFDNTQQDKRVKSQLSNPDPTRLVADTKVAKAYDIYKTSDGWQRDYIYYDITPGIPRGQFKYDYMEYITTFKLLGDGRAAYNRIADQTDPNFRERYIAIFQSAWTEGYFEFKIRVLVNASNGIGSEIIKYYSANPNDLFELEYELNNKIMPKRYELKRVSLKMTEISIPLINWDLYQYASSIKIAIEEVDRTEITEITDTRQVKYAANFEISSTTKLMEKVGLKFGSTAERTTTETIKKTYTEGNDELGDVIVNFADHVIVSFANQTLPKYRKYSSGWYEIEVRPIRVQ
ncbi:MAG: hypothetical protein LBV43_04015 [Prevotella sp.]|jgi:hypothetical protein|nr:hypothetical protein [Prevotella sp.]